MDSKKSEIIIFDNQVYIKDKDRIKYTEDKKIRNKIEVGKKIDKGSYKTFYKLKVDNNDKDYVIGIINIKNRSPDKIKKVVKDEHEGFYKQHELSTGSGIHFGIPRIYEFGQMVNETRTSFLYYVIMENGGESSLWKFLDKDYTLYMIGKKDSLLYGRYDTQRKINVSTDKEKEAISLLRKKLFYNMLMSLKLMHNKKPANIHLDIKPEQFVIKKDELFNVRLVDFGMTEPSGTYIKKHSNNKSIGLRGTPGYLSPQMLAAQRGNLAQISRCVDIFSLGVCFLDVICGYSVCTKDNSEFVQYWGCASSIDRIKMIFQGLPNMNFIYLSQHEKDYLLPIIRKMLMDSTLKKSRFEVCKGNTYENHTGKNYCCKYISIDEILKEDYFNKDVEDNIGFKKYLSRVNKSNTILNNSNNYSSRERTNGQNLRSLFRSMSNNMTGKSKEGMSKTKSSRMASKKPSNKSPRKPSKKPSNKPPRKASKKPSNKPPRKASKKPSTKPSKKPSKKSKTRQYKSMSSDGGIPFIN